MHIGFNLLVQNKLMDDPNKLSVMCTTCGEHRFLKQHIQNLVTTVLSFHGSFHCTVGVSSKINTVRGCVRAYDVCACVRVFVCV